jgi:hypothetical protein
MIPRLYCSTATGNYKPWVAGNVSHADLHRYKPENENIYINGVLVYALSFMMDDLVRVWNCQTGWQQKGML